MFKVQLTLEYQFSSTFSNMNIFGSIMSTESMIQRTLGGGLCSSPGDYLRSIDFIIMILYTSMIYLFPMKLGADIMEHYWGCYHRHSG